MSFDEKKIEEYLNGSKTLILATVNSDNQPVLRTIGGFAAKDNVIYFATGKGSEKTKQLEQNPQAALLFQHENQEISKFVNISINGSAKKSKDAEEFNTALNAILTRRPQLKATQDTHNIYVVNPSFIKILDFSKEQPQERVTVIKL